MQRPDTPDAIALALALREQYNCPLVIEIDDNIYDVARSSTSYQYWYPGSPLREIAELLISQADALTVSTPALAEAYKHLNDNIFVLPNFQDLEDWEELPYHDKHHNHNIILGWQGSSTHYDDLWMIRKPLKKLLRNYKRVTFQVTGMKPDFLVDQPRVEISTSWSKPRDWPKTLQALNYDIGIAPVVDRPFNQGKSNIKWQEYSMLEIPTIASKVGEYKSIEHNVTGLLAYSEDEWYFHLERLVLDNDLRKTLGKAAKQEIITNYSMADKVWLYDQAYQQIIGEYHGRSNQSARSRDSRSS
jgi:glycosyltransferase involved in cell wall biosynthesis